MILVADSGSSKTDWLLEVPGNIPKDYITEGLNPYFKTEREIIKILQAQANDLVKQSGQIDEVYFFGAGCSSPDRRETLSNALSFVFPKSYISVDSDLLGSAYSTCGHHKGLCCVLGTGSNISFFDGEDIFEGKHGLGFVLGDEGSGNWFGKQLVTDFLYGKMPADVRRAFAREYPINKEIIMENVYQKKGANTYLAMFANFLSTIRDSEYAKAVIRKGFLDFIETNIKTYPEYHTYKCHFVGSVAYHFSDELKALCKQHEIEVGKIIQKPIKDLFEFILSRSALNL